MIAGEFRKFNRRQTAQVFFCEMFMMLNQPILCTSKMPLNHVDLFCEMFMMLNQPIRCTSKMPLNHVDQVVEE
jgi:hypothetical protein